MPEIPFGRDIEQGNLEQFRLDQLNTDGHPPTCSTADNNINNIYQRLNIAEHLLNESSIINEGLETVKEQSLLHLAVGLKNMDAVNELLKNGASVSSWDDKGQTPLHLCVEKKLEDILEILIKKDPNVQDFSGKTVLRASVDANWLPGVRVALDASADVTIKTPDGNSPLHLAIKNSSKDIIKLLLKKEPNLTAQVPKGIDGSENSETVMDMIIHNVPKPTEFLKEVLDSYISFDNSTMNRAKIDYEILMPCKNIKDEMKVIETLLKTGNEYKQQDLLLHPLIESFIHLKWRVVRPYYFQIAGLHIIFMTLLSIYVLKVFYFKDIYKIKHEWYYLMAQGAAIYLCIIINIIHELFIHYSKSSRKRYLLDRKNWIQLVSLGLTSILPPALLVQDWKEVEWPRHIATGALLFTWIQMLIILSQYPRWGYFVVMFGKVAYNVFKILGTFSFLIIGFAFSFMIQFHSQAPFESPWDAIVKTLFLLPSEFEYNEVFKPENAVKLGSSFQVVRLIFVAFLFLATIVLMNMMIGVAVDDIKDLKSYGDIGRLGKQAVFVSSLDNLEYNFTKKILHVSDEMRPTNKYCRPLFPQIIILGKDDEKSVSEYNIWAMPKRFREAFFSIAQNNKEEEEKQKNKEVETEMDKRMFTKFDELETAVNMKIEGLRKDCLEIQQFLINSKEVTKKRIKSRRIISKRNQYLHTARTLRVATSADQPYS